MRGRKEKDMRSRERTGKKKEQDEEHKDER